MDENDKPDGSTAMERLAREMMNKIASDAATSWCRENGFNVICTTYAENQRRARADIERRIDEARAEDDCADGYAAAALKELTGMHRGHAMCTRGEVDEMVAVVEGWKAEAAELDALRGAGRVAPEGCRWPRFGDGSPLALGGEAYGRDGERLRVVAVTHRGKAAVRPWGRTDGRGARWVPLSSLAHERPDSWERLRDDALKTVSEYWGCGGWECHECPASVGGETPRQRYRTTGCFNALHLDIVARAERLAGVRGDA